MKVIKQQGNVFNNVPMSKQRLHHTWRLLKGNQVQDLAGNFYMLFLYIPIYLDCELSRKEVIS